MKTQHTNQRVEGGNHPLPPRTPSKQEEITHHHHVEGGGRRRNRHDHGVSMIVVLHNYYLLKSINRSKISIVKGSQFSYIQKCCAIANSYSFLKYGPIKYHPLICSPEQYSIVQILK
jgi:hypothetical protein